MSFEHVIFASYGNDSVALIQWAASRGLDSVAVIYSDTGWAQPGWQERVETAEAWARSLGFEPFRTKSEGMGALIERKKAWPRGGGGKYQFCTQELKIKPALAWLQENDPDEEAICLVGIRREESRARSNFPEWTERSDNHGGRSLWAPLVRHTKHERDILLGHTPFKPLGHHSRECWPCVNARKGEIAELDDTRIKHIADLEAKAGINSKGNARVMFSPQRSGGAIGIVDVVKWARDGELPDLFQAAGCDSGWCST